MRNYLLFLIILIFVSLGNNANAQVSKFQALYLVNFTKNLDWPGDKVTIGVVGNSNALIELQSLVSKYPNISLRKISEGQSVSGCQLIYLPAAQSRNISLIQRKIGTSSIILVAEEAEMVNQGAEIGFFLEGNKLKFKLNKSLVEEAGVKISERLLQVAQIIN